MRPAPILARWQLGPLVGGAFEARLVLDEPAWFAGHYPGAPIFPGTFLVEALLQAVLASLGSAFCLDEIVACRFYAPLFPGDEVRAAFTLKDAGDGRMVVEAIATGRAKAAQVTLVVAPSSVPLARGTFTPPLAEAHASGRALDAAFIRGVLPHRPPALLLDSAFLPDQAGAPLSLRARKAITVSEPSYADSGASGSYPPPLIVESFCQACGLLRAATGAPEVMESSGELSGDAKVPVVAKLAALRFLGDAAPGDVLEHHVQLVVRTEDGAVFSGQTVVGDRVILRVGRVVAARARLAIDFDTPTVAG